MMRDFLVKLNLSEYIINKVLDLISTNKDSYSQFIDNLVDSKLSEKEYLNIKTTYKDDLYNFHILSIYLLACHKSLDIYKKKGISEQIFYDTMNCFSRFIKECLEMNNVEYFDRDFWVHKQVSLKIFRLGILEYELIDYKDKPQISIHIPSDAVISKENMDDSLNKLTIFLEKYYPEYSNCLIYCESWLLAPKLKEFLDEGSRILIFQNYFDIKYINLENKDYIGWLFKCNNDCDISLYPEVTSLQKKVKKALLEDVKIGEAYGILKK